MKKRRETYAEGMRLLQEVDELAYDLLLHSRTLFGHRFVRLPAIDHNPHDGTHRIIRTAMCRDCGVVVTHIGRDRRP